MACSHQLHRFLLLLLLPFSAFLFSLFFPLASASLSSVSSVFSAPRLVLSCFSYFSVFLALVGCEVLCCFVFTLKVCFFGVHRNCWIIFYVLDCVKMFIVMGIDSIGWAGSTKDRSERHVSILLASQNGTNKYSARECMSAVKHIATTIRGWPIMTTDRTKRVKDARSEAQKEIEEYRKQKEEEFKKFESEVPSYIPLALWSSVNAW